jgi:hypothetical protein
MKSARENAIRTTEVKEFERLGKFGSERMALFYAGA